ncbi:hypothetical protein [Streptomyces puniciscabiei]|uniref:hypothetical protein n=1 Tax=Streptomyces puniciscabiei TaxID=164348 RepID=UPI0033304288
MDQGLATFLAAVIGVGGALAGVVGGAITGVRAARTGARVQGQVNFHEWLRQQQRAAYAEMHTAAMETLRLGHAVARSGPSQRASLDESLYKLVRAGSTVGMVGPQSLEVLAGDIAKAAYKLPGAYPGAPADRPTDWPADWGEWTTNVTTVLTVFTDEASKVISSPPALE